MHEDFCELLFDYSAIAEREVPVHFEQMHLLLDGVQDKIGLTFKCRRRGMHHLGSAMGWMLSIGLLGFQRCSAARLTYVNGRLLVAGIQIYRSR